MTRRARWRAWRQSRPFWGGLLLVLAGLELVAIPLTGVLGRGAIKLVIYIGIGGVFGVLIGLLLITAGIAAWANPAHRVFYGIAGIVLGIVSFPASNLGGFFLGMLLAIIGGSIGFAWTPGEASPMPAVIHGAASLEEPSAGIDIMTGMRDEPVDETSGAGFPDDGAGRPGSETSGASGAGEPGTQPAGESESAAELGAGPGAR